MGLSNQTGSLGVSDQGGAVLQAVSVPAPLTKISLMAV